MKLQCTYTDESELQSLTELLSSYGYEVSVKPKQGLPAKVSPKGNLIRWITAEK